LSGLQKCLENHTLWTVHANSESCTKVATPSNTKDHHVQPPPAFDGRRVECSVPSSDKDHCAKSPVSSDDGQVELQAPTIIKDHIVNQCVPYNVKDHVKSPAPSDDRRVERLFPFTNNRDHYVKPQGSSNDRQIEAPALTVVKDR
jgi:hypothetical protein